MEKSEISKQFTQSIVTRSVKSQAPYSSASLCSGSNRSAGNEPFLKQNRKLKRK